MQDVRYAFRAFRRQPVFTLVAVLTLTIGIGGSTAIFSLLYQVILRPLPFPHPDRLVWVGNAYLKAGSDLSSVSIPDYLDRRRAAPSLEDATLFTPVTATLDVNATPEQVTALAVTPSFFSTLGRGPVLGRAFADDDVAGGAASKVVILTDATWRSRFGADPQIVGRSIRVNAEACTVVGVLPRDFFVPWRDTTLLLPFAFTPAQASDAARGDEFSWMIGRLRPGATIEQLDAQMDAIVQELMTRVPDRAEYMRTSGFTGRAASLQQEQTRTVRAQLFIVQSAVVLVLLIACANVGNLLLMRVSGRQRELAIRTAIGAARARIARQMLVEGLLLAAAGGALGVAASVAGVYGLIALAGDQLPLSVSAAPDLAVLLFAISLTAVSGVFFGIVPALTMLRAPAAALLQDSSSRGTSGRRAGTLRRGLVIVEAAVAVVLLVGAGLLVRSFERLSRVNPGFNSDHVLTAQIALPETRYPDGASRRVFWQRLQERARAIPGVRSAGFVSVMPLSGDFNAGSFNVVGRPVMPGQVVPHAFQDSVSGDYFKALQVPLVAGRVFTDSDTADAPRVAIIDTLLAKQYFADRDPLGQQLNFGSPRNYTIVGVVGTVNAHDLSKPVPEGRIDLSAEQLPASQMGLVLKAAVDPEQLTGALRAAVRAIDPEQPLAHVRAMDGWIERSLQPRRTPTLLLTIFAAVALALAAIGIYGVLAFSVAERIREFGVRQALGADRASILRLVLSEGLRTVAVGLALGILAALILSRYLQALLFGVAPGDPLVLCGAAVALLAVAFAACYLPAHRATAVDPMAALRV